MARAWRGGSKERYWRQHVAAWRRSGRSVRDYCRAEGLSEPSFYSWRRVLAERGRGSERACVADGKAPLARTRELTGAAVSPFVPVRLVEETLPATTVEVVLRGGRVVRVAAGFAAQTLREVVAALEDLPC